MGNQQTPYTTHSTSVTDVEPISFNDFGFPAKQVSAVETMIFTVSDNPIMYRYGIGSNGEFTLGHYAEVGKTLRINGNGNIKSFRAISTSGTANLYIELSTSNIVSTVEEAPVADFSAVINEGTTEVQFTNETTSFGNTYLWDFGDETSSTEENPLHEYADTGTYHVVLTASNRSGVSKAIDVIEITIIPIVNTVAPSLGTSSPVIETPFAVSLGTWENADSLAGELRRVDTQAVVQTYTADGTYTPVDGDFGHTLKLYVTAEPGGVTAESAATAAVAFGITGLRWLDPTTAIYTDSALTTPAGDGDAVGGWADRIGTGDDASNAGSARPALDTDAFGAGKPGVTFVAASSQYLAWNGLGALIAGDDLPFSLVMAVKMNSIAATTVVVGAGYSGSTNPRHFLANITTTNWRSQRNSDAGGSSVVNGGVPDTSAHVLTFVFTGTAVTLRIDGDPVISAVAHNVTTATLFNRFTLGALGQASYSLFADVTLGDVFFAPAVLTSDEIDRLESVAASGCGVAYPFDLTPPDIFIVAGQSNASGRGTNNQAYTGSETALMYANDYVMKTLADPVDSSTSQVDTVSSDSAAGSAWPLLATEISDNANMPTIWVPCAKGATSITEWLPDTDHEDRATLYGSMVYRAKQVQAAGTLKAVLWWLGETDALAGMSQATYNGHLDTIANAVMADLGVPLMACKLQNSSGITDSPNEAAINDAIAEAWADNANVLEGPDLSDIGSDDDYHLQTDAKLLTAAQRWWAKLAAEFYS